MLTALDFELFPDDCEVIEIPSRNLWIYLIQKNGTSSLRYEAKKQDWSIIRNQDLKSLSVIDIYLRDPKRRYLSGINTFVQHLLRDNPTLDKETCIWTALRYPFLNRHFLPQWHWIANLSRFISNECVIRLHEVKELEEITKFRSRAEITPYDPAWADSISHDVDNLELWFLLDKILLGCCGQELTWSEILNIYRHHPIKPLDLVTERFQQLTDVLRTP